VFPLYGAAGEGAEDCLRHPLPPLRGGITRFSTHLLEALREDGCSVEVVGFRALWPRFLQPGRGTEESPVGRGPLVLYNPRTWFATARELKKNPPDILLAAYWGGFLAPLLFVLRRVSGIRAVALLHNMSSHESFFFEPAMRRLLARTLEGAIILSETVSLDAAAAMPSVPFFGSPTLFIRPKFPFRCRRLPVMSLACAGRIGCFFFRIRPPLQGARPSFSRSRGTSLLLSFASSGGGRGVL